MPMYEIVIDGEVSHVLGDSFEPLHHREEHGATVLSVPGSDPQSLADVLEVLESLGIGVTAVRQLKESRGAADVSDVPDVP
jgi:hypothetical protein